jgi:CheY-like chemotaxis protein
MSDGFQNAILPTATLSVCVELASLEELRRACRQLLDGVWRFQCRHTFQESENVTLSLTQAGRVLPLVFHVQVVEQQSTAMGNCVGAVIPGHMNEDRQRAQSVAEAARDADVAPARTIRILLVEDNLHIVQMYSRALHRAFESDHTEVVVEYAVHGLEAYERLGREPKVDLLISDLHMPVMDGFGLIEKVRRSPLLKGMPILIISAGDDEAQQRAEALGVEGRLIKPVVLGDIVDAVRRLVGPSSRTAG